MPIHTLLFLFSLLLFSSGCQSYYSEIKPSMQEEKVLQATRSGNIVHAQNVKAIISATYLNMLLPEQYEEDDTFIVGIYINDDMPEPASQGIYNTQFTLHGPKGQRPTTIRKLAKDDPLFEQVPTLNRWKHYYLITFDPDEEQDIILSYSHELYGQTELKFNRWL